MLTLYKYEGKNQEEIENNILEELNTSKEDLIINIKEEEGKLFKSKKYYYDVVKKSDIIKYVKEYIKFLAKNMNITINSEVNIKDDVLNVILVSDNNSILIGKDGRTLSAIQVLLRNSINSKVRTGLKINIDASNYKVNKQKKLEFEIKKIAKEILSSKVSVKLDPMNSYERRCVHNVITKYPELKSISHGEDPNRYVEISYKED